MRRRELLAAAGTLAVAGCLRLAGDDEETAPGSTTATVAATTEAATATGEPTETTERTTATPGPVTGLEADWTVDAGSNFDASVGPDLAVVTSPKWGSTTDGARALDARTGDPRWTALDGRTVLTALELADGGALLGTADGTLAPVDADGAVRWRQSLDGLGYARPGVAGDAVVGGTGDVDGAVPSVVRLDAETGSVDWRVTDDDVAADYDDVVSVAVRDGVAYVGYTNGVGAYALADGEKRWGAHANLDADRPDSLLVDDDRVYVHRAPGLAAYDRASGEEAWFFEPFDTVQSRLVPGDGALYLGSADASVYAVDADGSERWRTQVQGPVTQVAPAGDALVAATENGDLALLGRADGALRTTVERERTDVLAASADGLVTADGSGVTGHALVRED